MSLKEKCTLADNSELRKLIIDNPTMPLLIFCGEESWNETYCYEKANLNSCGIQELTLYNDIWLEKEEYMTEIANAYCDFEEYKKLSKEDFGKMLEKKIEKTEFIKAIVVIVG